MEQRITPPVEIFSRLGLQNTCKALGITPPTLYSWVRNGILPPPKYLGEKPYWSISDIEASMKDKSITNK